MASKKSIASKKALLFCKSGNNRLIVSAHGGMPANGKKFACPGTGWTANIPVYRTSAFGLATTSQVQDIVDYRNDDGPYGAGGNIWQVNHFGGQQTDWSLSQYATKKGKKDDEDSYAHYKDIAENGNFDVASPVKDVNVSTILSAIPNKDVYKEIWFSFCLVK